MIKVILEGLTRDGAQLQVDQVLDLDPSTEAMYVATGKAEYISESTAVTSTAVGSVKAGKSQVVIAETDPVTGRVTLTPPIEGQLASSGNKKFATAGDSIFADATITVVNAGYTSRTWSQWGPLAWVRRKLGLGISLSFDRQFATSGHTLAQIRSIQLPQIIASGVSRVAMDGGINSVTNGVAFADMIADLQAIFDGCYNAGIFIDYVAIRACANGNITDQQARVADRLNRWIAAYAAANPRRIRFHDWNSIYLDLSTGYAKTTYLRDGKHDNSVSAYAAGVWLAARLGTPELPVLGGVGDTYSATDNPAGNAAVNPKMTGTGGGANNGVTGSVPTSYSWYRVNNTGTVTAVASIEADDVYTGINRSVITLGGTADGNVIQFQQTQAIPGNFAVGDKVRARLLVEVNIPTGYQDLALYLASRDGSYVKWGGESWDGVFVAANGALPAINETNLVYETEPFVIGAGATVLDFFFRAQTPASGSLTGVIKVKALDIRKVG